MLDGKSNIVNALLRDGISKCRLARAIFFVCAIIVILTLTGCGIADSEYGTISESAEDQNSASLEISDKALQKSDEMIAAEDMVRPLVENYGDRVAVVVVPLDGSEGFSINGGSQFVSASMIKLLILAEYMDEVDAGTLCPDGIYSSSYEDLVGGTGAIQSDIVGTTYSYEDLACYMIMYSDNVATNVLIDLMGFDAINEQAIALGLSETSLQRRMMDLYSGVENYISANDAAALLLGIANHTLSNAELCSRVEDFLQMQTDNDGLAAGLPDGVVFGHKTGSLDSIRHDGGIVYAENPYVIVVLTDIGAYEGNSLMKNISHSVYECLK